MNIPDTVANLPTGPGGRERSLTIGYSPHGDVRLKAIDGEQERRYALAHGGDVTMFASLFGYIKRAEVPQEQARALFERAVREAQIKTSEYDYGEIQHFNSMTARGGPLTRFDVGPLGWRCLMLPVGPEPGAEYAGAGTALFTVDTDSTLDMVISRVVDTDAGWRPEPDSETRYSLDDVPPLASALCRAAMGTYKTEMGLLVKKHFAE